MYKIKHWLIDLEHPLVIDSLTNEERRIGYHDHLVILMLCREAGRILTKEDLLKGAWPGKHVSEGSLTQSISAIRNLIEDNGKEQKHLKTVAKVGYKLESEAVSWQSPSVDVVEHDPDVNITSVEESCDDVLNTNISQDVRRKRNRNHLYIAIGCLSLIIAVCFPFLLTEKHARSTGWHPFTKIFSAASLTIYCDNKKNGEWLSANLRDIVDEKIASGKLKRLIIASSKDTLSIVIIRPSSDPINLVVLLQSSLKTDQVVKIIKKELNNYAY
ncbi:transcriptional regulator [Photobacterium leiognathi subsp. mandapamensis]|nr:transcriptional regulator [Photobacterium leiognathi subsp. mandapamensis]